AAQEARHFLFHRRGAQDPRVTEGDQYRSLRVLRKPGLQTHFAKASRPASLQPLHLLSTRPVGRAAHPSRTSPFAEGFVETLTSAQSRTLPDVNPGRVGGHAIQVTRP